MANPKGRGPKKPKVTLGDLFSTELKQENNESEKAMNHQNIGDMTDGDFVESTFFCTHKNTAITKQKKPYLNLTIADRTGDVTVRVFDDAERIGEVFIEGDFIYLQGRAQVYQGNLQVIAKHIERVSSDDLNPEDFMPASHFKLEDLNRVLRAEIESIGDEQLRRLCTLLLEDPEIGTRFQKAPAAKSMHHGYIHGLLEHTLSMMRIASLICTHYKNLNRDMLLTGILFHDVGKIYELSYDVGIDYSDSGKLLGHITMGVMILEKLSDKIEDFSEEKKRLLEHILLAHHGTREFGSPVLPATAEADIIHHIDNLDAKVNAYLNTAQKSTTPSDWTDKHFLLGTQVRKTVKSEGPLYDYVLPAGEKEDKSE